MTPSIRFGTIFQLDVPNGSSRREGMLDIAYELKHFLKKEGINATVSLDESVNPGDEKNKNARIHVGTSTRTGQGDKLMGERNALHRFLSELPKAIRSRYSLYVGSRWDEIKHLIDKISPEQVDTERARITDEDPFLKAATASGNKAITVELDFIQNA